MTKPPQAFYKWPYIDDTDEQYEARVAKADEADFEAMKKFKSEFPKEFAAYLNRIPKATTRGAK